MNTDINKPSKTRLKHENRWKILNLWQCERGIRIRMSECMCEFNTYSFSNRNILNHFIILPPITQAAPLT